MAGDFVIDAASAAGFHVIPGDGTDPFDCSRSNAEFDCPNRALCGASTTSRAAIPH